MNRRGFFGALVGGIAAAAGALPRLPRHGAFRCVTMLRGTAVGKSELRWSRVLIADEVSPWPLALPGPYTTERVDLGEVADLACETTLPRSPVAIESAPPTAPVEPPPTWPDHHEVIDATAELSPIAQMKRLVDLFGSSGEAGPAFVEALIGELVLTRVRLAAADPRVLCSFESVAA